MREFKETIGSKMPRRIHPSIKGEIERRAKLGDSAAEIERHLARLRASGDLPGPVPHLKTIQRIARAARPPAPATPGDAWNPKGAGEGEAMLVLPVLAEVIERSRGHIRTFSRDLAEWIVAVRRAAPTLPPWEAYELSVEYLRAERGERGALPMSALDAYLAFHPWDSEEGAERWQRALERGFVPLFPPDFFSGIQEWKQDTEQEEQE
jgi:hypothetical protein